MIDVIRFQWRVRREVETAFRGHAGDGARLLVALQDSVDLAKVIRRANDAAFVAVIAGEQPQAFSPRVVHDVVHVADRAFRESVSDAPRRTCIRGSVDVNYVAGSIVEVLSPENRAAGNCCDVQWPGAARNLVSYLELALVRTERDDCSRHGRHHA